MYKVVTTKDFDKAIAKQSVAVQQRIVKKVRQVAADPHAPNNNIAKLQGRDGYRLRIGDWRVLYDLQNDKLVMLVLTLGPRGSIYK